MPAGTMQGVVQFIQTAFEDLGAPIPKDRLEKIAVMVYAAMCSASRNYHNLDHVFNFSNPPDPIRYLAAAFHDIVYYQVDDGIPNELEADILPYIKQENGTFLLTRPKPEDDGRIEWLMEVFGFHPGQQVTFNQGLNEYLSALVTVKSLGGLISEHDLFQVVTCIEATIPFRGLDEQGRNHFEVLAERLCSLRDRYPFFGTPGEIDTALQRAVIFSNQDVETFAMQDLAQFLVITFKLLPESNVALRKQGIYTIREYRIGLQKSEKFLRNLNPDYVFNTYKNFPPKEVFASMVDQTRKNLWTARRYLVIKLLSMGILEGLAEATGGDAPLSLFMGDPPRNGMEIERMEDYLPENSQEMPTLDDTAPDFDLLRLLKAGVTNLSLDLPYSRLSLLVYKYLSLAEQDAIYVAAVSFFSGNLDAEAFLKTIPSRLLNPIANACARMVYTRREMLLEYT